jgi:hypothetical protein
MVGRNRARYLAPIALAATITATYLVVHAVLADKRTPAPTHLVHRRARHHRKLVKAGAYVVQSGDTLSSISSKTGIPVPTLQQLNPGLDANALQIGQRLRLRR